MMTTDKKSRSGRWVRRCILILVVLAVLALFFRQQQNDIQTQTVEIQAQGLPAAFDGLRIVHLSDLHGKQFGQGNETLLQYVADMKPDLIAVTGDWIDRESQMENVPALAKGLSEIAPTYYVTGNHEWAVRCVNDLKKMLRENGVRVLSNEFEIWEKDGATVAIAGVDDPNGLLGQKTGDQLRGEIEADYTVLLSHRDTVETYSKWGYDLVLCGHGHGGIIRIPLVDKGLLGTSRNLLPKYDGGLVAYEQGGYCFVSRGLGSNTTPIRAFRLFNRPDLPLLILRSEG